MRPEGAGAGDAETPPADVDGYKERLLKYIPAEVVALYLTLTGVVATAPGGFPSGAALWGIFAFGAVATPFYLSRIMGVGKRRQQWISTGAFAIWAFALGGPFETWVPFREFWAALILPTYTFLIPLIDPDGAPDAS